MNPQDPDQDSSSNRRNDENFHVVVSFLRLNLISYCANNFSRSTIEAALAHPTVDVYLTPESVTELNTLGFNYIRANSSHI